MVGSRKSTMRCGESVRGRGALGVNLESQKWINWGGGGVNLESHKCSNSPIAASAVRHPNHYAAGNPGSSLCLPLVNVLYTCVSMSSLSCISVKLRLAIKSEVRSGELWLGLLIITRYRWVWVFKFVLFQNIFHLVVSVIFHVLRSWIRLLETSALGAQLNTIMLYTHLNMLNEMK